MSFETYISHAGNRGSIPLGAISPLTPTFKESSIHLGATYFIKSYTMLLDLDRGKIFLRSVLASTWIVV